MGLCGAAVLEDITNSNNLMQLYFCSNASKISYFCSKVKHRISTNAIYGAKFPLTNFAFKMLASYK